MSGRGEPSASVQWTVLRRLQHGLGLIRKGSEPAVMLVGGSVAVFDAVAPVITALQQSGSRLDVVLCSAERSVRDRLQQQYPALRITAGPLGPGLIAQWVLGRLRVRTVVFLDRDANLRAAMIDALQRRNTPVVLLSGSSLTELHELHDRAAGAELIIAADRQAPKSVATGVHVFSNPEGGFNHDTAAAAAALLLPLLGRDRKWHGRRDFNPSRWLGQKLVAQLDRQRAAEASQPLRAMAGRLCRFDDLEAVRRRLGKPRVLLALGNGPSSEDPAVLASEFDVLFRANHSWLARGSMTQASVVFTGQKASMKRLPGTLLGVYDRHTENVLLATRALSLLRQPLEYLVLERLLPSMAVVVDDSYRPTSGAIMLAVAVALEPAQLQIAGMDMFQHPDGSYPGDRTTPNAYTPAHAIEPELRFILGVLEQFNGELIIHGEVLTEAWKHHSGNAHRAVDSL